MSQQPYSQQPYPAPQAAPAGYQQNFSNGKGFFGSLYDFGFTSFVTTRVVGALYIVIVALSTVCGLISLIVTLTRSSYEMPGIAKLFLRSLDRYRHSSFPSAYASHAGVLCGRHPNSREHFHSGSDRSRRSSADVPVSSTCTAPGALSGADVSNASCCNGIWPGAWRTRFKLQCCSRGLWWRCAELRSGEWIPNRDWFKFSSGSRYDAVVRAD